MTPRNNKEKAVAVFLAITFVGTSFFYVSQPVKIFAQIPIPTQVTTPVAPGAPLFIADLPTAAAFPKPVVTLADFWGMFLQGVIKAAEAAGYSIIRKYVRQGLSNLTKDVWKQLLTGGKGQQEMFRTEPWEEFWQQAGDEAVGSAVEGFAQGFQNEYDYQQKVKATEKEYTDSSNKASGEYSEKIDAAQKTFDEEQTEIDTQWKGYNCENDTSDACGEFQTKTQTSLLKKTRAIEEAQKENDAQNKNLQSSLETTKKEHKKTANKSDANIIAGNVGALSEASRIFVDVVCKPEPNIAFGIFLGLGDQIEMKKRKPICPLSTLKENWQNVLSNTGAKLDPASLSGWNALAGLVNPDTSDLGVAWKLSIGGQNISSIAKSLGETGFLSEATVGQIKNLTDFSGKTNTPASVIKSLTENSLKVQIEEDTRFIPTGHLIADLILTAGSTVLSTSLNILTEGLRKKKAIASSSRKSATGEAFAQMTRGNDVLYNPSANPSFGGVEAAEARLAEFNKLDLSPPQDWNILATLTSQSCPEGMEGGARGGDIDACVMDEKFAEAVKERITVKEAISRVLIDKNGVFGFDISNNGTANSVSWQRNFPYRSLVIMRKYRVLPVSWELAALYIQEKPAAAKDKCGGGNCTLGILIEKSKDSGSPFYGMIDENWVLKIPPVQCMLKGYGSEIQDITTSQGCEESNEQGVCTRNKQVANVTRRPEQCVDIRTCLDEEEEGKCNKGRFGSCIQEQKIIRFKGEQCDEQFNGCELFQDAKTNQQALYIKQSLIENADFTSNVCTPQNAGCQWYSNKKQLQTHDVSGNQMILLDSNNSAQTAIDNDIIKEWSATEKVYFASTSDKLESCEPEAEGCRAIEGPAGTPAYLRLPPSSLQCEKDGVKESGKTVQWYKREDCKQYTQLCKPQYEGCKQYIPQNDTIAVTGIQGAECPSACANIYSYAEQKTLFDSGDQKTPAQFVNFNSQTAQKCSIADVGCEEFTNLDTVSRGGEGKEYYTYLQHCKKEENIDNIPADEVFYSFVGSDTAGGQPEKYYVVGEGSSDTDVYAPKCADPAKPCDCIAADAVKQKSDPRIGTILCREFINSKGKPFYRYTDNLIYRTTDCSSYRRTIDGAEALANTYSPQYSRACSAQSVNCREYRAPQAGNVRVVSYDNFESGNVGEWRVVQPEHSKLSQSNEGEIIGDHSLKIEKNETGTANRYFLAKETLFSKERAYSVSFKMKSVRENGVFVQVFVKNDADVLTPLPLNWPQLSNQWQTFEFSLGSRELRNDGSELLISPFSRDEYMDVGDILIDDIVIKEREGVEYLIRDSWTQNSSCFNATSNKNPAPNYNSPAYPNCSIYTDKQGGKNSFMSFEKLCPNEMAGCVKTKVPFYSDSSSNSDYKYEFIIPDAQKACRAEDNKCTAYGSPKFHTTVTGNNFNEKLRITKNKEDWNIAYYKITPEEATTLVDKAGYDRGICKAADVGCREYKVGAKGDNEFFRNPGMKVCQPPAEGEKDWFYYTCANDSSVICTVDSDCPGTGSAQKCDTKKKNQCQPSFVKTCERTAAGCRKIIDPECSENLTLRSDYGRGTDDMPCTREYFFTDDFDSRTRECKGIVNVEQGCLLFNDEALKEKNGTDLKYDSSKYYDKKALTNLGDATIANNNKDANILVKVKQDRNCKLWTSCAGSYKEDGRQDPVCFKPELCDKWGGGNSCDNKDKDNKDKDADYYGNAYGYSGINGDILGEYPNGSIYGAGKLASLSGIARPDYLFPNAANYTTQGGYGFNFDKWDQGVDANVPDRTYAKIFPSASSTAGRTDFNITNSCRLYPQQNSTQSTQSNLVDACRTTSGSWGVYGFCLEPYPTSKDNYYARNNFHRKVCTNNIEQNCGTDSECGDGKCGFRYYDNACLTWFPVDRIRGQQNLFVSGRSRELSVYNGPSDVYYCAKTDKRFMLTKNENGGPLEIKFRAKDTIRDPIIVRRSKVGSWEWNGVLGGCNDSDRFKVIWSTYNIRNNTNNKCLSPYIHTSEDNSKLVLYSLDPKSGEEIVRDLPLPSKNESEAGLKIQDIASIDYFLETGINRQHQGGSGKKEGAVKNQPISQILEVPPSDAAIFDFDFSVSETMKSDKSRRDAIDSIANAEPRFIARSKNIPKTNQFGTYNETLLKESDGSNTCDDSVLSFAIFPVFFNDKFNGWKVYHCNSSLHVGSGGPETAWNFMYPLSIKINLKPIEYREQTLHLRYTETYCKSYVKAVHEGNAVPNKLIESFETEKEGAVQLPKVIDNFEKGRMVYKVSDFNWFIPKEDPNDDFDGYYCTDPLNSNIFSPILNNETRDRPIMPDGMNADNFSCKTIPSELKQQEKDNRIDGPKADRNIKVVMQNNIIIPKSTPFQKMYEFLEWDTTDMFRKQAYFDINDGVAKTGIDIDNDGIADVSNNGAMYILNNYWDATKKAAKKPVIYGSTKTNTDQFGYDPMESANFDDKTIKFWFYVDYNEKTIKDTADARRAQLPIREITINFGDNSGELNVISSEKDGKGFANIPPPLTPETGDIFSGYGPFSYTYSDSAIDKTVTIKVTDNWGATTQITGKFEKEVVALNNAQVSRWIIKNFVTSHQ